MATSEYVIEKLDGEDYVEVERRKSKPAAVRLAEQVRASERVGARVVNGEGKVLVELPARARPFTRVEPDVSLPKGVKLPKGYEVAYQRKRINTLVLRSTDSSAKMRYLLFDTTTGATLPAKGTVDAREKTNKLRAGELKYPRSKSAA